MARIITPPETSSYLHSCTYVPPQAPTDLPKLKPLATVLPPEKHPLTLRQVERTAEFLAQIERGEWVSANLLAELTSHPWGPLHLCSLAGVHPTQTGYTVPPEFAEERVRQYAERLAEDGAEPGVA